MSKSAIESDAELNATRAKERAEMAQLEAMEAIEHAEKLRKAREELRANRERLDAVKAEFFASVKRAREAGLYLTAREVRDVALDMLRISVAEMTIRPDAEEIGIVRMESTKEGATVYRHYRINESGSLIKNGLPALGGKKTEKSSAVFDD